jgi:23S rRNA (cytosine1962-C5)-methyltransferase
MIPLIMPPHEGANRINEKTIPRDHREAIGIDRPLGLLGNEVVHHAEEARGQEESHGVVSVPPLHHGIHGARVDRIGLHQSDGDGEAVDHMEHGHGQDETTVEPVCDVDVRGFSPCDRAEKQDCVGDPDHGDQ